MVFYYTYGSKTEVFAKALGEFLKQPTYKLESDLNDRAGFSFMFKAVRLALAKKAYPVRNMPVDKPAGSIFVCSPVWGGGLAAPARYFLENTDLAGVRVNVLLTAGMVTEKYRQRAYDYLNQLNCVPGQVYLFAATSKIPPEHDVLIEQYSEIIK
ncbi:MAG: hypothetical protein FWC78_00330 [Defluviitaleaceae bacterium]|nr:hypothetical protein [Defluviitaleaceae bacterium]